jgi:hypothetical protein
MSFIDESSEDKSLHEDQVRAFLAQLCASEVTGESLLNSDCNYVVGLSEQQFMQALATLSGSGYAHECQRYPGGILYKWTTPQGRLTMSHWLSESTPYKISIEVDE